ncbi:hypothetical protein [Litorimonas haliclonae]|uniref:hypothetical protein n=1 Tax=Litorimonas haliclonae TaxID=2081977 RepID=UPI0039F0F685
MNEKSFLGIDTIENGFHRDWGVDMSDWETPRLQRKTWFNEKGQVHCKDGPARQYFDHSFETKPLIMEEWYIEGRRHRLDGPATTFYHGEQIGFEEWWVNGALHRDGAPAILEYDSDKNVDQEWWYQNGLLHREYGPAETSYDGETGFPLVEQWYFEGSLHRVNNPAVIERDDRNGAVTRVEYWTHGRKIDAPQSQFGPSVP